MNRRTFVGKISWLLGLVGLPLSLKAQKVNPKPQDVLKTERKEWVYSDYWTYINKHIKKERHG